MHLQLSSVKFLTNDTTHHEILQKLVFEHDIPLLHHLDLRGWQINPDQLKTFLSKSSATLKELRLVYNIIKDLPQLAQWAGENMCLTGVQMHNYDPMNENTNRFDRPEHELYAAQQEEAWLADRPNLLRRANLDAERDLLSHEDPKNSDETDSSDQV